ncbi:MAG TPA: phosphatase PAP2-related protein [Candidatus Paceibacterota bacterium]
MKTFCTNVWSRYRHQFSDPGFILSIIWSFAFLAVSICLDHYASIYALERASNPVTDIILSNIRAYDVDFVFIYGPVVFWGIITAFLLAHPQRIPFTLKSIALFVVFRTFFVSLTHIAPFPEQAVIDYHSFFTSIFTSGSDLFFSGHTGGPFLMALVFWKYRTMRIFCLLASVFFGCIVLLGHYHYTIDVVSAFFITYAIYHIAEYLFKKDYTRFSQLLAPSRES